MIQDIPLWGNDIVAVLWFGKKCSERFSCCHILYFSSGAHPLMSYIFQVVKEPPDVQLHFREREGIGMMGTKRQVWMYSDYWVIVQRRHLERSVSGTQHANDANDINNTQDS